MNYLEKFPEKILFTPIWESHNFLINNKTISTRNFRSLENKVAFPIDIMSVKNGSLDFLDINELNNKFNINADFHQFISLRQVIRNGMARLKFNFQMHTPCLPPCPAGKYLINISKKGCNKWVELSKSKCNRSIINCEKKWENTLGNPQGVYFWDRNY